MKVDLSLILGSKKRTIITTSFAITAWLYCFAAGAAQDVMSLPSVKPLETTEDLSVEMVAGINKFLLRKIDESARTRSKHWQRDFFSPEAYEKSIAPNRKRLQEYIGVVDARSGFRSMEYLNANYIGPVDERLPKTFTEFTPQRDMAVKVAETDLYAIYSVRWPVFEGVYGEGLLLRPSGKPRARIVALPDADQTPEMLVGLASGLPRESQFARRLAENGCEVLVPTLIDRRDTWSGDPTSGRFTTMPHREWIYRQAYEMGRHIIGYEVQKVLAAVDWFAQEAPPELEIGVAGYGEGGLIAFYSAALDTRIHAAWVSGYFDSRQRLWEEPIYRNVWGLLEEFGDAEIATLVVPRGLLIEYSEPPQVEGPPKPREGRVWFGRGHAAPGSIRTPSFDSVQQEFDRAKSFFPSGQSVYSSMELVSGQNGKPNAFGSGESLKRFLKALKLEGAISAPETLPEERRKDFSVDERQKRQIRQLEDFTQKLLWTSEGVRGNFFWNKLKTTSPKEWEAGTKKFKEYFWEEIIGRFPEADLPMNARARKIYDEPKWVGYEVVLDVWNDVFVWGYLLVPKDVKAGEKRPVVVCQHGLEGVPADTISGPESGGAYQVYKSFSARLADRGFVVFAPYNPYRGGDNFRVIQRKANPLKKSLFSVIIAQHERMLDWLEKLPFVDPKRIGFYGISYGGKTAMRVPSLLDRYALSICSADFNEWVRFNVVVRGGYYMFSGEYDMLEFNLGNTFNYAEMAALIAPRPFMVESSKDHPSTRWVAYEYAKVLMLYADLGILDRTAVEFFDGGHTINGVGSYEFLHRHLNWPSPEQQPAGAQQ